MFGASERLVYTVEPRLSRTSIIGLAIFFLIIRKWARPLNAHARCSCYYGNRPACLLRMRRQPCWHCCLLIKWLDQGVVYLFYYPAYSVIRPASGTNVSG